jgi:hypothetical protein
VAAAPLSLAGWNALQLLEEIDLDNNGVSPRRGCRFRRRPDDEPLTIGVEIEVDTQGTK